MRPFLALFALALVAPCTADTLVTLRTRDAGFGFDDHGTVAAITRTASIRNLVAPGQPAPVLRLRIGGTWHVPTAASWDASAGRLQLRFDSPKATASVALTAKPSHVVLELAGVQSAEPVELASWGPYPVGIGETIGEIVGVVRDRQDAVGIQALNAKTLGGSPQNENDIDAEFGADDTGHYPGLPDELRKGQHFRADTARPAPFGSLLQAYARNRDRERVIPNWGHDHYHVPPFADGGVVGSRIALFACPESRALETLGAIELAEGLPHPTIDGEWAKTARGASASYLIVDFGEATVDRAIEMTRRAGLRHLYHSSPFESWGHFRLKPSLFPHGWDGFRACVEKANRAGVEIGFHTLSNFITPSDSYVSPVPDPRLAVIGSAGLAVDTDADAKEIVVSDPAYFARKSTLNTVRIGDELVRFASVSDAAPWRLTGCERGAWGTRAAPHARGTAVARLLDHDYKVFFADAPLSLEIARNIAAFCNHTGARQLSFDGLEGNWSTGLGQYGRTLFTQAWHDALDAAARGRVINDASNPGHFNWHVNTRMNWGEPWYAGFRESQTLYRFKNQLIFERNYMPHMLGWFALRADTGIEDAEWLLARAAGFDAGFALATSLASMAQLEADPESADTARRHGATTAVLAAINRWESARMRGAFTPAAKALLRDNTREFHLRTAGADAWDLLEAHVRRAVATNAQEVAVAFTNPGAAQPLRWIVRTDSKAPVPGLRVVVDGRAVLDLKQDSVPAGGSVKYEGGTEAVVADAAWKEVRRVPVDPAASRIPSGNVPVSARAEVPQGIRLSLECRTLGAPLRLTAAKAAAGRP